MFLAVILTLGLVPISVAADGCDEPYYDYGYDYVTDDDSNYYPDDSKDYAKNDDSDNDNDDDNDKNEGDFIYDCDYGYDYGDCGDYGYDYPTDCDYYYDYDYNEDDYNYDYNEEDYEKDDDYEYCAYCECEYYDDYDPYDDYDYCEYNEYSEYCTCEEKEDEEDNLPGVNLPDIAPPSIGPVLPAVMPAQTRIIPFSDEMEYIFVSIEGFNLGHGFYIEPMRISIWDIGGPGATVRCATDFAVMYVQNHHWAFETHGYGCCYLWLDWDSRWDGGLAGITQHGRGEINAPMHHLSAIENNLGGIWYCCFSSCCPIGDSQQHLTGFGVPPGWGVTVDHFLSQRSGSDLLWGGEVIRWQASWTINAAEHFIEVENDFGVPDFLNLTLPFFTHHDKSELFRAATAYGLPEDVRAVAFDVILNPTAGPLQIMQTLHWVRTAIPEGEPCTRLTVDEARNLILSHDFGLIQQPWLPTGQWTAPGDTRTAGITRVRAAVEDLLYETGVTVTNLTPNPNNFIALPNVVIGGVPATERTFRATITDGIATTTADFTVNLEFLHAEATGITVDFALPRDPHVGANTSAIMTAAVFPVGIPQEVEWHVEGQPGVSIDANGVLSVGDVPVGTSLTVVATRIPTDADPNPLYGSITLTVVDDLIEWAGTGTAADPFLISRAEELVLLAERVNNSPRPANNAGAGAGAFAGVHFLVTANIQLDETWPAIGTPFVATAWVNPNQHQGTSFEGIFDGGGHILSFAFGSQPLFGAVWHNAVIRNVDIFAPFIAGHGLIAGVAAQFSFGTPAYVLIENVRILPGSIIRGSGFAGTDGFRPQQLDIRNSTVMHDVIIGLDATTGEPFNQNLAYFAGTAGAGPGVGSFVSGLAGFITNSVSYAIVVGHPEVGNIGGLVGYKQQSMRSFEINNSEFRGHVVAPGSNHVGGILGGGYDSPNPRNNTTTGQLGGAWAAPNSPGANILGSRVVDSVIIGYDNVGGIVGGEFVNQMWSTGSFVGAQHIVERNRFSGDVIAMRSDTPRAGAIFGYARSLNRNNVISDNVYLIDNTAITRMGMVPFATGIAPSTNRPPLSGFGQVSLIDTIHFAPTPFVGTTYFNTQGGAPIGLVGGFNLGDGVAGGRGRANYYRTDDPIGIDLHRLARADYLNIDFVVDKTMLNLAISEARTRVQSNYNPVGWPEKRTAYQEAVALYNNADATQSQVDAATDALWNALLNLRPAGEIRWVYLRVVNSTFMDGRVTGNILPRQRVYIQPGATAYSVLTASPLTVISAGTSLATRYVVSINGLAGTDGGPLAGWMYSVNGNFPAFSAAAFTLNHQDELAWLFTMDLGLDLIGSGIDAPNRTELRSIIAEANALQPHGFTDDSWRFLVSAIDWATYIHNLARATQGEIDGATTALRLAIYALELESDDTPPVTPPVTPPGRPPITPPGWPGFVTTPGTGTEIEISPEGELEMTVIIEDGTAIVTVPENIMALLAAYALYTLSDYVSLTVTTEGNETLNRKEINVNVASLNILTEKELMLKVQSPVAVIILDTITLEGLAQGRAYDENVAIIAENIIRTAGLTRQQRAVVGDNPVVRLTLHVNERTVSQFAGTVTVTLPFTPPAAMYAGDFDLLTVYHLNNRAQTQEKFGAAFYNYAITFTTRHFSLFFISEWLNPFYYITNTDWFFRGARFIYTHGLMGGTEETYLVYIELPRNTIQTILGKEPDEYCEEYVNMEALLYILYRFANPLKEEECNTDYTYPHEEDAITRRYNKTRNHPLLANRIKSTRIIFIYHEYLFRNHRLTIPRQNKNGLFDVSTNYIKQAVAILYN